MRRQSIVAMALAVGVLTGVSGNIPFAVVNKVEASTQMDNTSSQPNNQRH